MSMTREEAIEILENGGWWDLLIPVTTIKGRIEEDKLHEALDLALSALRGPTGEMMERMRGEWRPTETPLMIECEDCSVCGYRTVWGHGFKFCPACGSPMTDEAVEMVRERMEALKDGKGD